MGNAKKHNGQILEHNGHKPTSQHDIYTYVRIYKKLMIQEAITYFTFVNPEVKKAIT